MTILFGDNHPSEFDNGMAQAEFPWGLDVLSTSAFDDEQTIQDKFFDGDTVQSEIEKEIDNIETDTPF